MPAEAASGDLPEYQNSVAVLIEQAYDRMLEEEQLSAGWEEEG